MTENVFNNKPLNVFLHNGRPCLIAKEFGYLLDYADNGRMLISKISNSWSRDFKFGKHYFNIMGRKLVEFNARFDLNEPLSLMLLSRAGIDLVLKKTSKRFSSMLPVAIDRRFAEVLEREGVKNNRKRRCKKKVEPLFKPESEPVESEPVEPKPVEPSSVLLESFIKDFEGISITNILYRGRLCWIANEVGEAIGYGQDGKVLSDNIRKKWADEFEIGHHYAVISGNELVEFKKVLQVTGQRPVTCAPSLTLLFEPGLNLVFDKTTKPVGVRFRKFISEEVVPQLTRSGRYLPERTVVNNVLIDRATGKKVVGENKSELENSKNDLELKKLELKLAREKLQYQERKEERQERQMKSEAYAKMASLYEQRDSICNETVFECKLASFKVLIDDDKNLPALPTSDFFADWKTPAQIAESWGISPRRVGIIISELGIRGDIPGICRPIYVKSKFSGHMVTSYAYSPEAIEMIEEKIVEFVETI